jgi:hypothetical protein
VAFGSVFEPVYNFSVKLLDTNGTEHDPIIKMPGRMGNANGAFHDTGPHSTYETMIPINNLNPALLPGQYRFLAKRLVFLRRNGNLEMNRKLELFSNLLEVQVK